MTLPCSARAASLALLSALLPAQIAEGTVRGFDGKPIPGAIVVARTDRALATGIDALTDSTGRFRVVCPEAIARLSVQLEGVVIDVPLPRGGSDEIDVSFESATHAALRGRVVLPDGKPAAEVEITCRGGDGKLVAPLTTDATGQFQIRIHGPLRDLLVDPLGWRHVVKGPISAGEEIAIDLGKASQFFRVEGIVRDMQGQPAAGVAVQAMANGRGVGSTRTLGDGTYALWANRPVDEIQAVGTEPRIVLKGAWAQRATADLDARTHGVVMRVGRCLDAAGQGCAAVLIFATERDKPPPRDSRVLTTTGSDGWFRVMLPRDTPFLFAWKEAGNVGATCAVPEEGVIKVRLGR